MEPTTHQGGGIVGKKLLGSNAGEEAMARMSPLATSKTTTAPSTSPPRWRGALFKAFSTTCCKGSVS